MHGPGVRLYPRNKSTAAAVVRSGYVQQAVQTTTKCVVKQTPTSKYTSSKVLPFRNEKSLGSTLKVLRMVLLYCCMYRVHGYMFISSTRTYCIPQVDGYVRS